MLRASLVDSVSCIVVSVWRPCFVRVLSTVCRVILCLSGDQASCGSCRQCVMYCCVCLVTMLRAGNVDSVSCNVVSVWRPCFVRVLSTVYHVLLCLSGDHALCGSCRQCVMYCCVCLATMLCAGLVDSVSCIVVCVWRPCFVQVLSTVCRVMLCLSGDHASCKSCRQCVMYCCVCLATMLRAGLVDSVSCNLVSVWRPSFVRVLSTVCHVLLCLSGDHASCW